MRSAVIILPTFNEKKTIDTLIHHIFEVAATISNWKLEVLVVDSSSPDGTANTVKALQKKYPHLYLITTPKEGLGKAYIRGFSYALEHLKPFVLFEMDSDLSHNPKDIPLFLKKIEEGADLVVGSRYIPGGSIPSNWAFQRKLFSVAANWFVRLGFMKLRVTEWTNGYRAIRSWLVTKHLKSLENYTGYVFQVAFLDKAIKSKARIAEIPVKFVDRIEGASKIDSFEYIFQTVLYVLQHSPFIKFCIVGGMGFIVDFGFAYIFINSLHLPKVLANMVSAEIAIICNFMLNNYWSFAHKRIHRSGSIILSLMKFNLVSSGSVIIQGVGMWLALSILGDHIISLGAIEFHSWILYKVFIILLVIIPYSYFFYNRFVWREK